MTIQEWEEELLRVCPELLHISFKCVMAKCGFKVPFTEEECRLMFRYPQYFKDL